MFNIPILSQRAMFCSLFCTSANFKANFAAHRAAFIFGLLLAVFAWATPSRSMAATNVMGVLTTNTVWTLAQSPITLQGDVVLDQGAVLIIEPGVQVLMQAGASFTVSNGALQAVGTAANPIVITSAKATPAPGDWGQWRFLGGTNSAQTQMDNVRIEYGSGVVIEKSSPTLNRLAINHHNGAAINVDLASSPVGQELSASGNLINAIVVPAGFIKSPVVWGLVGIPYLVQKGVVVIGQPAITLEPSTLATTRTVTSTMRIVFPGEAPPVGTPISVSSSDPNVLYVSQYLGLKSPGGTGQSVEFEIQPYGCGDTVLTAAHAKGMSFLSKAEAKVSVTCLPTLNLVDKNGGREIATWAPLLPYGMGIELSKPAPTGGQLVYLSAPGNDLEIPPTVTVPAGETFVAFTVKGTDPAGSADFYSTRLNAQANGYEASDVRLNFQPLQIYTPSNSTVVQGTPQYVWFELSAQAPQGGLRVLLESSDPTVFTPDAAELIFPEGDGNSSIYIQGKRPGQARLRVYVPNMVEQFVDVTVVAPTTTSATNKEVRK